MTRPATDHTPGSSLWQATRRTPVKGTWVAACAVGMLLVSTATQAQYRNDNYDGGRNYDAEIGAAIGVFQLLNQAARANRQRQAEPEPRARRRQTPRRTTRRTQRQPNVIPNARRYQMLITFGPDTTDDIVDAVTQQYGLRRLSDALIDLIDRRIVKVARPAAMSAERALQLANDPRLEAIQPNYTYTTSQGARAQYAVAKMAIPDAHTVARGRDVLVAVIDSGVNAKHPAIRDAIEEEFDPVGGPPGIFDSHGTAVASIIAARKGVMGVAPEARLLSVKAFNRYKKKQRTTAESFHLLKGLDWAADRGARVLNMSFAGPSDPLFRQAIVAAAERGIVSVAAAGNKGPKAPPAYPAAYPEVIAVTATDAKDRLYRKSNRGSYIAVSAPGVDVLTAGGKKGYGLRSGTSFAAAYISGSIALMAQNSPSLSPASANERLAVAARDLGPEGKDPSFGHGLVDIYKAVNGAGESQ